MFLRICVRLGYCLASLDTILVQSLDKVLDLGREMLSRLDQGGIGRLGISLVVVAELRCILLESSKDVLNTALFEYSSVLEWQIDGLC